MLGVWSILDEGREKVGARFIAELAKRVASSGKRVLVFELCPARPALDIAFGVAEKVVYTLSDVGAIPPSQAILSPRENLFFVPSALDLSAWETAPSALTACIEEIDPDVVLILFERAACATAKALSDGILLLTDASEASLRAGAALTDALSVSGAILTDFVPVKENVLAHPAPVALADLLGVPLLGILPRFDASETARINEKNFLRAVDNVAKRIAGEHITLLSGISIEGMRKRTFFEG